MKIWMKKKGFDAIKIADLDLIVAATLFFDPFGSGNFCITFVRYLIIAYLLCKNFQLIWSLMGPVLLFFSYGLIMAYSTYCNTNSLTWMVSGFAHVMQIVAIILTFSANEKRLGRAELLKRLLLFYGVVLLITDVAIAALPYDRADSGTVYPVGNKFIVAYSHCFLAAIVFALYGDREPLATRLFLLYCAAMSAFVTCTTGLLMAMGMLVLSFVPKFLSARLATPTGLFALIILMNFLIWGSVNVFNSPIVQDFMVNVLGKSPNMTGREKLYAITLDLVKDKPVFGYGYLTDIYREKVGYGNAQNGLFHIITQAGVSGTIAYFSGLYLALKGKSDHITRSLYLYLYAMALGSAVEICLSMQFSIGVALLCACRPKNDIRRSKLLLRKIVRGRL